MEYRSALERFLGANRQTEFIHYHFVDLSGFLCDRCVTRTRALELEKLGEPIRLGSFGLTGLCSSDQFKDELWSGWDTLRPDWETIRAISPAHASVMCNYSEQDSGHPDVNPDDPFLRCPRSTLRRAMDYEIGLSTHDMNLKLKYDFLAGFEMEFFLVEPGVANNPSRMRQPQFTFLNAASSLRDKYGTCLFACVKRIEDAGIPVEAFHSLKGPQMFQISTGPLPPLQAVDALVQSQEIIRVVAVEHNLRAINLPQPWNDLESCGLHLHLSINYEPCSFAELDDIDHSSNFRAFLAGVLRRLPLLAALGLSHEMSYKRVRPLAVGKWVSWGLGNRDTPVRGVTANHWEMRALDATANVYLVVAGYIAAGIRGILDRQELTIKGTREHFDTLPESIRLERGIKTPMPTTLQEAMEAFDSPDYKRSDLNEILGPQILDFYSRTKKGETRVIQQMGEREREQMMFEFY